MPTRICAGGTARLVNLVSKTAKPAAVLAKVPGLPTGVLSGWISAKLHVALPTSMPIR